MHLRHRGDSTDSTGYSNESKADGGDLDTDSRNGGRMDSSSEQLSVTLSEPSSGAVSKAANGTLSDISNKGSSDDDLNDGSEDGSSHRSSEHTQEDEGLTPCVDSPKVSDKVPSCIRATLHRCQLLLSAAAYR